MSLQSEDQTMPTTTEEKKKITLRSFDGQSFEVEEAVAMASQTVKHMVEDGCADGVIPVANVSGKILSKVMEYCKKHVGSDGDGGELRAWDAEFVKDADQATLFDLVLAASYLDIRSLLDITTQAIADMIKDLSPEEVRRIFHIKNDFTPEEEEEVRRSNQWAFE